MGKTAGQPGRQAPGSSLSAGMPVLREAVLRRDLCGMQEEDHLCQRATVHALRQASQG